MKNKDMNEVFDEILELNTMDSFKNGEFKIKRNGEIITLTSGEMDCFKMFQLACDGRGCLDFYKNNNTDNEQEINIINKLREDIKSCFDIENEILDKLYEDCGIVERLIIKKYIGKHIDIREFIEK